MFLGGGFMEVAEKSGRVKFTVEMEINPALMELIKDNMSHMMDMASQWRQGNGQGNKEKMSEAHSGMMHHG
jgi:hypothetical protein